MFQTKVAEKIKIYILCTVFFFRKSCLYEINWKNNVQTGRQRTDSNMAHAHCMLDTYGYKHRLRICNTYCFSTAKTVIQKRLNITLYVHLLSCLNLPKFLGYVNANCMRLTPAVIVGEILIHHV